MVSAAYILGIDLGTTTCRCAIFDLKGLEVAAASCEIPVNYPRPLWAEVDPEVWWQGVIQVVREALTKSGLAATEIAGVGLSGLMHAPVLLDRAGRPVAPAMLWMDQRCAPQCEVLNREAQIPDAAPFRFSTTFTAPKLRWLADRQPEVLKQVQTVLLPKDFVRYRLTNTICTDPSDAGGTALFNEGEQGGDWDWDLVRLARAPEKIMPPIWASEACAGRVTPVAARLTGLAPGTVVAVGGGDTRCTRLGSGQLTARELYIYLGTAVWTASVVGTRPDGWPIVRGLGSTATTGAALRWVRDLLAGNDKAEMAISASYEALTNGAAAVQPGAEDLFFLPHLMGERGPKADPLARGALIGLTLCHSRPQIVRAILEGTAFHLRRLLEAQPAAHWPDGGPAAGVASGGVARSSFWMQLLADVTRLPLRVPAVVEAGALGAAILGGVAAGVVSLETASTQMIRPGPTYTPNPVLGERYDALYKRYCQLDDLLGPWFREVSSGAG